MAKPATQAKFAKEVGVSQQEISAHLAKGHLTRGASIKQWRLEYAKHFREISAQHKSEDGKVDAVKEGGLLKRAQREEIEIKLAQLRRELWPVNAIASVLDQHNTNAKNRWLSLPTTFKSICPHISPRDVDRLDSLVRENLTEQVNDQLSPDIRRMVQEYWEELHAASQADGQPVGGPVSPTEPGEQRGAGPVADGPDAVPPKNNGRGK